MWITVATLTICLLLALWGIITHNRLVTHRNRTRNAWAQIDVQLKRRHDLIPNLVNAVKGAMEHERSVLEAVTKARQQAIEAGSDVAKRAAAEAALTRSLGTLFAVAEAYPALRANENVLALQEEISSTENKIAFARQFYNDAVMQYNTARERFPASLIAGSFEPAASFSIDDATERAVPQVRL